LHPELDIQLSLFDHTDKPHIAVEYNDGSKQRTDTFKYWPYDDTNVPPLRRMNWEVSEYIFLVCFAIYVSHVSEGVSEGVSNNNNNYECS